MARVASFGDCGLLVGHQTDAAGATGCTVIRGETLAFRAGVHVLGRATGTREIALLEPSCLVDRVDAILFAGGSAYGLDAAAGVMRWMEERGRGFPVGSGVVPIVPAAVLFDLTPLGRFDARPTALMAYDACASAERKPVEGSVGAGTGATVGKITGSRGAMKGGIGFGAADADALCVRALAVVNALGDVRDKKGAIIAGARRADGSWLDSAAYAARGHDTLTRFEELTAGNTTLCVVSTNVNLDRAQLTALARASSAALYKRITPVATPYDGDIVFATAPLSGGQQANIAQVEALAVQALSDAIERAVKTRSPGDVLKQ